MEIKILPIDLTEFIKDNCIKITNKMRNEIDNKDKFIDITGSIIVKDKVILDYLNLLGDFYNNISIKNTSNVKSVEITFGGKRIYYLDNNKNNIIYIKNLIINRTQLIFYKCIFIFTYYKKSTNVIIEMNNSYICKVLNLITNLTSYVVFNNNLLIYRDGITYNAFYNKDNIIVFSEKEKEKKLKDLYMEEIEKNNKISKKFIEDIYCKIKCYDLLKKCKTIKCKQNDYTYMVCDNTPHYPFNIIPKKHKIKLTIYSDDVIKICDKIAKKYNYDNSNKNIGLTMSPCKSIFIKDEHVNEIKEYLSQIEQEYYINEIMDFTDDQKKEIDELYRKTFIENSKLYKKYLGKYIV